MFASFSTLSIRRKLTYIVMLTAASALILACATFVVVDVLMLRSRVERDLETLARVYGSNVTAALQFRDAGEASEILATLHGKPSIRAARLFAKDGRAFASYVASPAEVALPDVPQPDGLHIHRSEAHIFQSVRLDGERVGTIYIQTDLSNMRASFRLYLLATGAILIVALLVAYVMSERLQRVISAPLAELAAVANEVSLHRNYSVRARARRCNGEDEINNLVHGFNEMLAEIQRRDEALGAQVRQRTHELQMILDTAAEGIFGVDGEGIVTFINPAAAAMLGATPEQLVGRCCHDFLHTTTELPPGPLASCSVCSCTLLPVARVSRTSHFRRAPGESFPVEYTASTTLSAAGGPAGVVVTFRDITERLAVERMKNEFVSTVSHELRTPLASIRAALGLLAAGLLGDLTENGRRMLEIAINNSDRLVRLINDILDLERMESGNVELRRRLIDAHDLVTQAVEVMQGAADRAGTRLVVDAERRSLWVDNDRMIQTLTNLISNAIKFSPRGATITVSASGDDAAFSFRVADEGRGIPPEKLEVVFERFQQVDASDSREKGGTGLGLAICRSIVTAHGGRIWAESTEGEGSVFHVLLPVQPGSRLKEECHAA